MGRTSCAAKNRYNKKTYDDIRLVVPKGRKADVEEYCRSHDTTVNGLINELLRNRLGLTLEQWKARPQAASVPLGESVDTPGQA